MALLDSDIIPNNTNAQRIEMAIFRYWAVPKQVTKSVTLSSTIVNEDSFCGVHVNTMKGFWSLLLITHAFIDRSRSDLGNIGVPNPLFALLLAKPVRSLLSKRISEVISVTIIDAIRFWVLFTKENKNENPQNPNRSQSSPSFN